MGKYYVNQVLPNIGSLITVAEYISQIERICTTQNLCSAKAKHIAISSLGGASNAKSISISNGLVERIG